MTDINANVRLYVGNLPYAVRSKVDAVVMMEPGNRDRSKGFGFVSMSTEAEAERAVAEMNGREVEGRVIVCNIAKPRENNIR